MVFEDIQKQKQNICFEKKKN